MGNLGADMLAFVEGRGLVFGDVGDGRRRGQLCRGPARPRTRLLSVRAQAVEPGGDQKPNTNKTPLGFTVDDPPRSLGPPSLSPSTFPSKSAPPLVQGPEAVLGVVVALFAVLKDFYEHIVRVTNAPLDLDNPAALAARLRAEHAARVRATEALEAARERAEELEVALRAAGSGLNGMQAEKGFADTALVETRKARDEAREAERVLAKELEEGRALVAELEAKVAEAQEQIADREDEFRIRVETLEKELQQKVLERDSVREKAHEMESRLDDLKEELVAAQSAQRQARAEREALDKRMQDTVVNSDAIQNELATAQSDKDALEAALAEAREQVHDLSQQNSALAESNETAGENVRSKISKLEDELRVEIERRSERVNELEILLKNMEEAEQMLSSENQIMIERLEQSTVATDEAQAQLVRMQMDKQEVEDALVDVQQELAEVTGENQTLTEQLAESSKKAEESLRAEMSRLADEARAKESDQSSVRLELEDLKQQLGSVREQEQKLQTECAELRSELSASKAAQEQLALSHSQAEELEASLYEARTALGVVSEENSALKLALSDAEAATTKDAAELSAQVSSLEAEVTGAQEHVALERRRAQELYLELEQQTEALKHADEEVRDLSTKLNKREMYLVETKRELLELKSSGAESTKLEDELRTKTQDLVQTQRELLQLKEKSDEIQESLDVAKTEVKAYKMEFEMREEVIHGLWDDNHKLTEDLKVTAQEKDEIEAQTVDQKLQIAQLQSEVESLRKSGEEFDARLEQASQESAETVKELEKEREELKAMADEAKGATNNAENSAQEALEKLVHLEAQATEAASKAEQMEQVLREAGEEKNAAVGQLSALKDKASADQESFEGQLAELRERIASLEEEKETLRGRLEEAESKADALAPVTAVDREVADLRQQVADLEGLLAEGGEDLEAAETEISELRRRIMQQESGAAARTLSTLSTDESSSKMALTEVNENLEAEKLALNAEILRAKADVQEADGQGQSNAELEIVKARVEAEEGLLRAGVQKASATAKVAEQRAEQKEALLDDVMKTVEKERTKRNKKKKKKS